MKKLSILTIAIAMLMPMNVVGGVTSLPCTVEVHVKRIQLVENGGIGNDWFFQTEFQGKMRFVSQYGSTNPVATTLGPDGSEIELTLYAIEDDKIDDVGITVVSLPIHCSAGHKNIFTDHFEVTALENRGPGAGKTATWMFTLEVVSFVDTAASYFE